MKDNKDKILSFLSENRTNTFDQRSLKTSLFPKLNEDEIKRLLRQIIEYDHELMKVYRETSLSLTVQYSGLIDGFILNGGFEKIESELNSESELLNEKKILEIDNLKLQKESSEYKISIREKDQQIRDLTRDSLRLRNWDIRFRWYIAIGSFIIGIITKYFIDK